MIVQLRPRADRGRKGRGHHLKKRRGGNMRIKKKSTNEKERVAGKMVAGTRNDRERTTKGRREERREGHTSTSKAAGSQANGHYVVSVWGAKRWGYCRQGPSQVC